jgi:putative ABC transport system ATP-binding protein
LEEILSEHKKQRFIRNRAIESSVGSDIENPVIFQLVDVSKSWPGTNGFKLTVPELTIRQGEKVALVGFSGSGKSTLLDLMAMVLQPDRVEEFTFFSAQQNRLNVADAWKNKNLDRLARARMRFIGYVLQTGGLLPFLSVYDNIGLCLNGLGMPAEEAVTSFAERLGIKNHLQKYPGQLSVGERQRVAIARAMAHKPSVVIADEPTASLDPINAGKIMEIFTHIASEGDVTLIVATHEWELVKELGFRIVKFKLKQGKSSRSVCAEVFG